MNGKRKARNSFVAGLQVLKSRTQAMNRKVYKGTRNIVRNLNRMDKKVKKRIILGIVSSAVVVGGAAAIKNHLEKVHSAEEITSVSVLESLGVTEETRDRLIEIRTDAEENENITIEQLENYLIELESIKLEVIKEKVENATGFNSEEMTIYQAKEHENAKIVIGEELTYDSNIGDFIRPEVLSVPSGSSTTKVIDQAVGLDTTEKNIKLSQGVNPYSQEELRKAVVREAENTLGYIPVEVVVTKDGVIKGARMSKKKLTALEQQALEELQEGEKTAETSEYSNKEDTGYSKD